MAVWRRTPGYAAATLTSGTRAVRDAAGIPLTTRSWSFTIRSAADRHDADAAGGRHGPVLHGGRDRDVQRGGQTPDHQAFTLCASTSSAVSASVSYDSATWRLAEPSPALAARTV